MALIGWKKSVGFTSWLLVVSCVASQTENICGPGWFGSLCQYKCWCEDNNCGTDGVCAGFVKCQKGWFGPACQYADLAYNMSILPEITDGDDDTCVSLIPQDNTGGISITLDHLYHFSWLRVHLNRPNLMRSLRITFKSEDEETEENCINPIYSNIDETTMDIHCDMKQRFKTLTLLGEGTQYLCSVYVSGGRNVALKNVVSTTCSVVQQDQEAPHFPTGVVYGEFWTVNSSGNNFFQMHSPNLYIVLPIPQHVTRYKFNDVPFPVNDDAHKEIELRCFNTSLHRVLHSTIKIEGGLHAYTVVPVNGSSTPIRLVGVTSVYNEKAMYKCDVEVYGDSACLPGRYGRECEHRCNCAGGQLCLASTGVCPSGCAAGFLDFDCSKVSSELPSRPPPTAEIIFTAAAVASGLAAVITLYHCGKRCCNRYRQNAGKLNTYDVPDNANPRGPDADSPGVPGTGYLNHAFDFLLNMMGRGPTQGHQGHEDDALSESGYIDVTGSGYIDVTGSGYIDVTGSGYIDVTGRGYIDVPESGYTYVTGSGYIDATGSCTYSEQDADYTT